MTGILTANKRHEKKKRPRACALGQSQGDIWCHDVETLESKATKRCKSMKYLEVDGGWWYSSITVCAVAG